MHMDHHSLQRTLVTFLCFDITMVLAFTNNYESYNLGKILKCHLNAILVMLDVYFYVYLCE